VNALLAKELLAKEYSSECIVSYFLWVINVSKIQALKRKSALVLKKKIDTNFEDLSL
jgi:hypothetical protein